jgi:hypothetical protein
MYKMDVRDVYEYIEGKKQEGSVRIVMALSGNRVSIFGSGTYFCLFYNVQTGSWAHQPPTPGLTFPSP